MCKWCCQVSPPRKMFGPKLSLMLDFFSFAQNSYPLLESGEWRGLNIYIYIYIYFTFLNVKRKTKYFSEEEVIGLTKPTII